jgi:predicted nucleotidyltransferase
MKRDRVLKILAENRDRIGSFSVSSLSIFGSVARDEAKDGSDVDILVEFGGPVGLFDFIRLELFLEELLSARVDLVTPDAIRADMRAQILRDAIRAA